LTLPHYHLRTIAQNYFRGKIGSITQGLEWKCDIDQADLRLDSVACAWNLRPQVREMRICLT
jgi:hypothetical protein